MVEGGEGSCIGRSSARPECRPLLFFAGVQPGSWCWVSQSVAASRLDWCLGIDYLGLGVGGCRLFFLFLLGGVLPLLLLPYFFSVPWFFRQR